MSAPGYFAIACELAKTLGEDTFMFYTGAPQNSVRADIAKMRIEEGKKILDAVGISPSSLVIHAPYIVNPASRRKEENFQFAIAFLKQELARANAFGVKNIVVHPGSHLGDGEDYALDCLADAIDAILEGDQTDVTICLETMAGKGKEVGTSFDFYASLFPRLSRPERVGLCLDTCHLNDAGYDLTNFDEVLAELDFKIGLQKVKVVHLNDSKFERGSHKDRHENIGYGTIGFDVLSKIYRNPNLKGVPFVLETPWIDDVMPYQQEIEMLRSGVYVPSWRESL